MTLRTDSRALLCALLPLTLLGCGTTPPLRTVDYVDIPRFMGRWYVLASIPTFLERDAYDAVESYQLAADGTVETTFTFRRGSFDGPVKTYEPRGYIESESNAVWGMQFLWPFKADYRVIYLDDDYETTIIGRQKRDYVWIMARRPVLPDREIDALIDHVAAAGYDPVEIVRVPQRPLSERDAPPSPVDARAAVREQGAIQ